MTGYLLPALRKKILRTLLKTFFIVKIHSKMKQFFKLNYAYTWNAEPGAAQCWTNATPQLWWINPAGEGFEEKESGFFVFKLCPQRNYSCAIPYTYYISHKNHLQLHFFKNSSLPLHRITTVHFQYWFSGFHFQGILQDSEVLLDSKICQHKDRYKRNYNSYSLIVPPRLNWMDIYCVLLY